MTSRHLATTRPSYPSYPRALAVAIFLGTLGVAVALPLTYRLGAIETARWLNQEDGPYEMVGALATLAAALLLAAVAWPQHRAKAPDASGPDSDIDTSGVSGPNAPGFAESAPETHASNAGSPDSHLPDNHPPDATAPDAQARNIQAPAGPSPSREGRLFLWLLALALLVMFGEEISWGQRIFAFATPDWMRQANIQREFNLHNLRMFHPQLTGNRLKPLWMLASFALLGLWPLLVRRSVRLQQWAHRWGVPRPSFAVAAAAIATFAVYVVVTRWAVEHRNLPIGHGMGEAAETAFELLYLLLAIEVARGRAMLAPRPTRRTIVGVVVVVLLAASLMIAGNVRQQRRRAEALQALHEAQTAIKQAQLDRAQAAAWRAVQLAPDTPEAHFYLGVALSQQGNFDQAAQAFETAVRLEPESIVSRRNLAAVLIKQGKPHAAIECLREALTISDDVELRHLLGLALLKTGDRHAAEVEFQHALKLNPQFLPAQAELQRLQQ